MAVVVNQLRSENQLFLDFKAISETLEKIGDKPVAIITIAGHSRTGKSFLLSSFIHFLSLDEAKRKEWLRKDDEVWDAYLKNIEEGVRDLGNGLQIWPEPFFIKDSLHREIGVILMRVQFQCHKEYWENAQRFAWSLLLSSIFVYDIYETIQESDIKFLKVFTSYATVIQGASGHQYGLNKKFQQLKYFIQTSTNEVSVNNVSTTEEIDLHSLRMALLYRGALEEIFDQTDYFTMKRPASSPADEFHTLKSCEKKVVLKFIESNLYSPICVKKVGEQCMSGIQFKPIIWDWLKFFEEYKENFKFVQEQSIKIDLIKAIVVQCYQKAFQVDNKSHNMNIRHDQAVESALRLFDKLVKTLADGVAELRQDIETTLSLGFEDHFPKDTITSGNPSIKDSPGFRGEQKSSAVDQLVSKSDDIATTGEKNSFWFDVPDELPAFIGRKLDLDNLDTNLTGKADKPQIHLSRVTIISGLGGIGKTTLARHYAINFTDFVNVVWVNGESKTTILDSFIRLGRELSKKGGSIHVKPKSMYSYFNSRTCRTLFVFDNVTSDKDIIDWIPPPETHIYVILISRNRNLGKKLKLNTLELLPFTEEDAIQFLKKSFDLDTDEYIISYKELARQVHYFPLALIQATIYVKSKVSQSTFEYTKSGLSTLSALRETIQEYKESLENILSYEYWKYRRDTYQYRQTILGAWELTLEKLNSVDQLEIQILEHCAYFSSHSIPIGLFKNAIPEGRPVRSRKRIFEAIKKLYSFSMVEMNNDDQTFSVHRLVQDVIRIRNKRIDPIPILSKCVEILMKSLRLKTHDTFEQDVLFHAHSVIGHVKSLALVDFQRLMLGKQDNFIVKNLIELGLLVRAGNISPSIECSPSDESSNETSTQFLESLCDEVILDFKMSRESPDEAKIVTLWNSIENILNKSLHIPKKVEDVCNLLLEMKWFTEKTNLIYQSVLNHYKRNRFFGNIWKISTGILKCLAKLGDSNKAHEFLVEIDKLIEEWCSLPQKDNRPSPIQFIGELFIFVRDLKFVAKQDEFLQIIENIYKKLFDYGIENSDHPLIFRSLHCLTKVQSDLRKYNEMFRFERVLNFEKNFFDWEKCEHENIFNEVMSTLRTLLIITRLPKCSTEKDRLLRQGLKWLNICTLADTNTESWSKCGRVDTRTVILILKVYFLVRLDMLNELEIATKEWGKLSILNDIDRIQMPDILLHCIKDSNSDQVKTFLANEALEMYKKAYYKSVEGPNYYLLCEGGLGMMHCLIETNRIRECHLVLEKFQIRLLDLLQGSNECVYPGLAKTLDKISAIISHPKCSHLTNEFREKIHDIYKIVYEYNQRTLNAKGTVEIATGMIHFLDKLGIIEDILVFAKTYEQFFIQKFGDSTEITLSAISSLTTVLLMSKHRQLNNLCLEICEKYHAIAKGMEIFGLDFFQKIISFKLRDGKFGECLPKINTLFDRITNLNLACNREGLTVLFKLAFEMKHIEQFQFGYTFLKFILKRQLELFDEDPTIEIDLRQTLSLLCEVTEHIGLTDELGIHLRQLLTLTQRYIGNDDAVYIDQIQTKIQNLKLNPNPIVEIDFVTKQGRSKHTDFDDNVQSRDSGLIPESEILNSSDKYLNVQSNLDKEVLSAESGIDCDSPASSKPFLETQVSTKSTSGPPEKDDYLHPQSFPRKKTQNLQISSGTGTLP